MNRIILVALASLAAVAMSAVAPMAAQAEPHWYLSGNVLVKKKTVKTEGGLTFGPLVPGTAPVSCKVRDAEILENPASGGPGVDKMKAFKVISCGPNPCPVNTAGVQGALKVNSLNLPWVSKLVEVPPIADEIANVELEFVCKKTGPLVTLSGTLYPWVIPGSLEFTTATGTLSGVNVTGFDNFLTPTVEAFNP
jgi:hypothetical protein